MWYSSCSVETDGGRAANTMGARRTPCRREAMKVEKDLMVPLGYGKFFRSEKIVGLEPVEEGRGPGNRTKVYIEALPAPVMASRSEGAILSDLVKMPKEVTKTREQYLLLS